MGATRWRNPGYDTGRVQPVMPGDDR